MIERDTSAPRTPAPRRKAGVSTRVRVASGSLAVAIGVLGITLGSVTGRAQAITLSPSAVTVPGGAAFPNLKITVGQTKDLINQAVTITWTGGAQTEPGAGVFAANYLQIMQCWGDDAVKGPDRTQCQFGASGDARGGYTATTRQVTNGLYFQDVNEKLAPNYQGNAYVPFAAVDGTTVDGWGADPYFDHSTTNEIPFAQTASDGTGQAFFEVETAKEAPGLGCGTVVPGTRPGGQPLGRSCWLVIVPRGTTEVDNTTVSGTSVNNGLQSSPLSQSNWNNRIAVPLTFTPLVDPCPLGQTDRQTFGGEGIFEAMHRWQPALCTANPVSFSYYQTSDDDARTKLMSPDPGVVLVNKPVPASQAMPNGPPVYAPVGLSGLVISFLIESQSGSLADDSVRQFDGTRMAQLNLTPRLVAKLLTQSYKLGVSPVAPETQQGGAMANNAFDLTRDPEFLAANPAFAKLSFFPGIGDIMSPLTPSDAVAALWTWIQSDKDARDFLSGADDGHGMVVNPAYKNLAVPRADTPKLDPFCQVFDPPRTKLCTLDLHPLINTMHDAARGAARGDPLLKTTWNYGGTPPVYGSTPPQAAGIREILAITDAATASRYGLQTAALRNASGAFVAPTAASMLASAGATVQQDGLAVPDPATKVAGAYPLTTLTYAATVPSLLDKAAGADYATFITYAAGGGQTPGVGQGQLPDGFAPMPAALQNQALLAAQRIKAASGIPVTPTTAAPSPTPSGASSSPGTPGGTATSASASSPARSGPGQEIGIVVPQRTSAAGLAGGALGGSGVPHPTTNATKGGGVITPTPSPAPPPKRAGITTPLAKLGVVRFSLLVLLIAGGLLTLAGPALRTWGAKIPRPATPPGVHLE